MAFIDKYPAEKYGIHPFNEHRYNPKQCAEEVRGSGRGDLPQQCRNKPGYGDRELFCKVHAKRHPAK